MSHDNTAKLTKPPLENNLDYCEKGLEALPDTKFTYKRWSPGWIPQEVKSIITGVGGLNFKPEDMLIYDVKYQDCADPWVFGYHKSSEISIDSMAKQFGKMPIQMRQWIKHVITVPGDNGWAFEWNGNITFVRPVNNMVTAIVHETGHSLDLNGAYADKPLSKSDNWWTNYDLDTNVPDPYSSSNAMEDVAQNTVVALFNENVSGGFASIEPKWGNIFHQYATLITEARNAGQGNSLLTHGENVRATHRLPNSTPVPVGSGASLAENEAEHGPAPDVVVMQSELVMVDYMGHRDAGAEGLCTLTW